MLTHFSDHDVTIGFFQVKLDPEKVCKKISKILGSELIVDTDDHYEDVGTFDMDTLIIRSNLFTEDLLDLLDYGIAVYIIDY